jgi:hypothetical protein
MKKLVVVLFLFMVTISFAQTTSKVMQTEKSTEVKVHAISYTVDSVKELETIDWNSVKEVFEYNNETEIIKMSFGIDLKKSKNNFKSSITVSGETKDIDSLIIKAKKGVNAIMKISKKNIKINKV